MAKRQLIRYRSSFETDRKIIFTLALEKEFAQYDLDVRIGKDYRTVLRRVQFLEKNGLVALARTEESEKGGVQKKILTLTEAGLLYALANPKQWDKSEDKGLWPEIDRLALNYSNYLPLIFGEWKFYKEKGLMDEIISRLQAAVFWFSKQFGAEWVRIVQTDDFHLKELKIELQKLEGEKVAKEVMTRHRNIAPTLTNRVLGLDTALFRKEWIDKSFILKLLENPRLREYLDNEFEYWVEKTKMDYNNAVDNQKFYLEIKAKKSR